MRGVPVPPSDGSVEDDTLLIGQFDGCNDSVLTNESGNENSSPAHNFYQIPVLLSNRCQPQSHYQPHARNRNLKTVKRSNKSLEALELPSVMNLNPRSIYNKIDEFHTLVSELEVDLVCMSESWEREGLTLDQIITLENYQVISNVHQRTGMGGRPALVINDKKFSVQNLTNTLVNIPYGVEITWAILTPKQVYPSSVVKKIAVASIYSKPKSRKKTLLLDHIAETYHMLCSKYQHGLHFILAGDTNDLKLESILSLSPNLKQVVNSATRGTKILDPIITTLSKFYQSPVCLPPLDNDPDKNGAPSDHKIVFMKPVNAINNNPARKVKMVKFRPLPESGIQEMGKWIVNHNWDEVSGASSAHDKAAIFQSILLDKVNLFLPEKIFNFTSEDQVWATPEIKDISRKKKREYNKNRKSTKWKSLNTLFEEKCSLAREAYYTNIVLDLKHSNPGQWHSKLKRMTSHDQVKTEEVIVESICHLSDQEQAEEIADKFGKISNEYEPINPEKICLNQNEDKPAPHFEAHQIHDYLKRIKTNISRMKNDIKEFAHHN